MAPRLLIIDDDPEMRDYLALALARVAGPIVTVDGADVAWPDEAPDLLFVDMLLGDAGERAGRWIQHARAAEVPVVLMTGLSGEDPRVRAALEAGGVTLLAKPFELAAARALVSGRT